VSPLGPIRRREAGARRRGPNPLLVAALTILLAAAVTYYAFSGKQIPFVHHFTMHALVRNSVDIIPDSPVRIAGIDVGQVTGTTAEGNLTKVNFEMSSNGLPVHKDATVTIRDRLFLEGGYYLQLDPGSPSAPTVGDGFTIPVSNTSYPVQFYQLLSTFDLPTRQSLENALTTLNEGFSPPAGEQATPENSGAGGFKSAVPQFTPTLKDIAWVSQALHGTAPGDVERLLSSASNVTGTLQGSSGQLADLVTSLNRLAGALVATDGSLGQTISGLDQTLQVAPPTLSAVDVALPPLVNLGMALDPSLKVAPPLVDAVTKSVNQLEAIVEPKERVRLLDALYNTFTGFPVTLRQLGEVFPVTKGVTDCLRTHVTPILTQAVNDGSLSTGRPVWQDFVHLLSGLSSAVQNFDANGYWIRLISSVGNNGISIGKLPLLGQILGVTPGSAGIEGARPQWVGDLTPSVFRPDVPCSSQPVPTLAAATAPADLHHVGYAAPPTSAQLQALRKLIGSRSATATRSGRR
jgi:phospholipid/cholesterol/gamma-HCH transport system substrate-binding protein